MPFTITDDKPTAPVSTGRRSAITGLRGGFLLETLGAFAHQTAEAP